jgi:hypothetical protein
VFRVSCFVFYVLYCNRMTMTNLKFETGHVKGDLKYGIQNGSGKGI